MSEAEPGSPAPLKEKAGEKTRRPVCPCRQEKHAAFTTEDLRRFVVVFAIYGDI
jgi:hypothetical protein